MIVGDFTGRCRAIGRITPPNYNTRPNTTAELKPIRILSVEDHPILMRVAGTAKVAVRRLNASSPFYIYVENFDSSDNIR
jgi:hypothetical protein